MSFWTKAVVGAALAGGVVLGAGAPRAEGREDLVVKRFLLGRLEANTDRFIATGARGTQNAYRDNVIMLVFSGPVNLDSLSSRTVRIGIPVSGGLFIDAEGAFYRYVVSAFDPVSQGFVPKRTYRNRVLFDPTRRQDPVLLQNPGGFQADATYDVTIPGLDRGALKTLRRSDGSPLQFTFTTTFGTTDEFLSSFIWCPPGDPD